MFGEKKLTTEHFWWAGIVLWIIVALTWTPEPRPLLIHAPSASSTPPGFHVFYELVAQETGGTRRVLQSARDLSSEIGVLVVLSPSEPISESRRKDMLDWVFNIGGSLIVAHPVLGEDGELLDELLTSPFVPICGVTSLESWEQSRLPSFDTDEADSEPTPIGQTDVDTSTLPPEILTEELAFLVQAGFHLEDCEGTALLADGKGRPIAYKQPFGDGTLVQLSTSKLLANSALGRKQTHLFAAKLIEEAGKNKIWAFDESYENIRPRPKYLELLGASRYRPIFLQLLLIGLFIYWYLSGRFVRSVPPRQGWDVREVNAQAEDLGDFYRRAQKHLWALERSRDYLRILIHEKGHEPKAKQAALELIDRAGKVLAQSRTGNEKHTSLIREIAKCQKMLTSKTRKNGK